MINKQNKTSESFSRELKLLVLFLRISLLNDPYDITGIDLNQIDWKKFVKLVKFHRVQGPIYQTILYFRQNIPTEILETLKSLCKNNGLSALQNTAEILQLNRIFAQRKLQMIPFKGISLSQYLYKDPGYRHCGDIDFLIRKKDINLINELLSERGYKRFFPDISLTPKQTSIFVRNNHHFEYFHPGQKIRLEAHWDFFPNKQFFTPDTSKIFDEAKEIKVSNNSFFTLPDKENIIYLMVHGSLHGYFRLFWLYDIAAFYCFKKNIDWERIYKEAQNLGLSRIFSQAFYLMNLLWSIPLPNFINSEINKFPNNYITQKVIKVISSKEDVFSGSAIQRFGKNIYQIFLKKGLTYKLSPIKRQLTSYHDWKLVEFPDKLFFLYYLFRPLFIIAALFKKDYFNISINKNR